MKYCPPCSRIEARRAARFCGRCGGRLRTYFMLPRLPQPDYLKLFRVGIWTIALTPIIYGHYVINSAIGHYRLDPFVLGCTVVALLLGGILFFVSVSNHPTNSTGPR
jgi:hypothetical protein